VTALVVVCAPMLAAAAVLGFRYPVTVVLPAFAATVPFGSLLSTGLAPPYDSVSTPLAMLLCAGLLREVIAGRTVRLALPATMGIWPTFLGVAGASAVWSLSPQLTQAAFRRLALLVLLYVLLALVPITPRQLRRLETALVVGGVAAACYGIAQFLTGTLPVEVEGGSGRFGRELLGANNTAAALIVPLALAVWRSSVRQRPSSRLAYTAASGALLLGIVLTGSRGGILATGATLAVMVASSGFARRAVLRRVGAVVLVLVGLLVVHPGGIAARTDKTSSSGRSDIWRVGIHACHQFCWAGSGWGTFSRVYTLELPKVPDARILTQGVAYEPHNIWLLLAVETGVLGFALALVGVLLTLLQVWRLPAGLRCPPLSGLVGTLVASFFLSNFEYKFFWLNLGYCLLCRTVAGGWASLGATRRPVVVASLPAVPLLVAGPSGAETPAPGPQP
jgi:O-antigen ligase